MMGRFIFGLETEYAVVPNRSPSRRTGPSQRECAEKVLKKLRDSCASLADNRGASGFFISNGGNFYIDQGDHVEYATPECLSPLDVVIWDKAGERLLERACSSASGQLAQPRGQGAGFQLFKNNRDYKGSTYGCHENYLLPERIDFEEIQAQLLPFLVTRQIFAGAGCLSWDPKGIGFELSQRVSFINKVMGTESTHNRAIINTREESLSRSKYRRLHLILGDSLLSEWATFLKVGTTGLLLSMLATGMEVNGASSQGIHLANPIKALRETSLHAWPGGRFTRTQGPWPGSLGGPVRIQTKEGHELTPLQIQRYYLRKARGFLQYRDAPSWAYQVVERWQQVLDWFEREPEHLKYYLDAYTKFFLFERHLRRKGIDWETIRPWLFVIHNLEGQVPPGFKKVRPSNIRDFLREALSQETFEMLDTHVRCSKMRWQDFPFILECFYELMEIDIRYHSIDRKSSLFYELDRMGFLKHRLVSEQEIEKAQNQPPSGTRAAVRGRFIQVLSGQDYEVSWTGIWAEEGEAKILDLSDPFLTDVPCPPPGLIRPKERPASWPLAGQAGRRPERLPFQLLILFGHGR